MTITERKSGNKHNIEIERADGEDIKGLKKGSRFQFNWSEYGEKEVELFKLVILRDAQIVGMMCLKDHTDIATNAVEIELIEASKENIGKNGKYNGIGGCLFAYASRESFIRGHEGFVFLTPKTGLIRYYEREYGFQYWPRMGIKLEGIMTLDSRASIELMNRFMS
ncbi:MAG TPA: hypothetical protein VHA52_13875 [Candidatus Babeliaceae bacterium]|nr:hypothetical protein [Candidatus Babeliaceae bacterium]